MFNPTTLESLPSAIGSPELACGHMRFDALGGLTIDEFGQALAPANLSARQAKAAGLMTSGICGPHSSTLSHSADLTSSLVSRLQAKTALLGSTLYKLTWKERATPSGRLIFALRASARPTSDKGYGGSESGWPTPQASGMTGGGQAKRAMNPDRSNDLMDYAQLAGWPTPMAGNPGKPGQYNPAGNTDSSRKTVELAGWRTPTAGSPNSLRGNGQDPEKRLAGGHTVNLTDEVNWLKDNPQPARLTACGVMLTGYFAGMESGGQLNPAHSRWLMGLPPEWDDCAVMATQSMPKRRKSSCAQP